MKWFKEELKNLLIASLILFVSVGFSYAGSAVKLFNTSGVPKGIKIAEDGSLDVNLQDQHTATLILPMAQELVATTLSADSVIDAYTVVITSAAGATNGDHIRIINSAADRYYFGTCIGISGTTVILDTPIDYVYLSGSEVTFSNINLSVNGSVTPVVFTLRTGSPSISSSVDVTRIMITALAASPVDLNKFGDITALTRGIVFRSVNDEIHNIFNAKSNQDLAGLAYDFTVYQALNPAQGIDGFACRLTFAGQNKIGVALRVEQDENLEMIIQDDLTGLSSLKVILEGHVVSE